MTFRILAVLISASLLPFLGAKNCLANALTVFSETPLAIGADADDEGAIEGGRYVRRKSGIARVAGSWEIGQHLQDGETYRIKATVRVVNHETGDPGECRILVRFASGINLAPWDGESVNTVFDGRAVKGERTFQTYVTYREREPLLGILGIDVRPGFRLEIADVEIEEGKAPWERIPARKDKTLLINDELSPHNSVHPTPVQIPPGATEAHVKLTYGLPEIVASAAVSASISHRGAEGFKHNRDIEAPEEMFFWRDGDDHDHWITFKIKNPSTRPGDRFRASLRTRGFSGKWHAVDFVVTPGAVNTLPEKMPYHRPPHRLVLPEQATLDLDMAKVRWSETGADEEGNPVWTTHPAYVYTMSSNQETGVYPPWKAQGVMGVNPHSIEKDSHGRTFVRLHTRILDEPLEIDGKTFPHQASMLQAEELDEWCHRRGLYRAQLTTPDRKGAWSAFWVVGRHGPTKNSMWPPEIDFFESFNGAYGAEYTPTDTSSGQHAGVHGSIQRQRVDGFEADLIDMGWHPETNLNTQIHDYACIIDDEWVTYFRGGIEFSRHRNISDAADGDTTYDFYPIVNVAVKRRPAEQYTEGSGDLRWYGLQYYAPDSGYELTPFEHAKPYPDVQILPPPDPLE